MSRSDELIRINELCRELGVKAIRVIDLLPRFGVTEKKTHSSAISLEIAEKLRRHFRVPSVVGDAISAEAVINTDPIASPTATEPVILKLPSRFSFRGSYINFNSILNWFDWSLENIGVQIDLTACEHTNYQALALVIQYAWILTKNGCQVTFKFGTRGSGATKMLVKMGAQNWLEVLKTDGRNFSDGRGRTMALRRRSDVQNAINIARGAIQEYTVGFPDYLSYIVSELLYNATEHGANYSVVDSCHVVIPSIFQFGRYPASERLAFFFSDLGVGVKAHLERTYPPFATHQDAIVYALRPNVSGTFGQGSSGYQVSNNAGMGLTYSSRMLKRLKGDMYIVSRHGLAHVSPEDVTTSNLNNPWPGTFVLVDLDISQVPKVALEELLREVRGKADTELSEVEKKDLAEKYCVSIHNYFGKWAEDKDAAISFRERHLIPAISANKSIELDFRDVETAPHSFLNALLSSPIRRLGFRAYQRIRVHNASGSIHEIVQSIFESNVPKID